MICDWCGYHMDHYGDLAEYRCPGCGAVHDLLTDAEYLVIEMCDVEIHGQCDRCDHPCPAYFEIDFPEDDEFEAYEDDDD